jgi:transposase
MAGKLPMGQKELLRGKVMELAKRGQMTIGAAAKELKVSYRQGRRIYAAYRTEGDQGLIHGNTGKVSNRKTAGDVREAALRAYREREPTNAELLKGITQPKSHFGRACDKLGVEVIPANSPQAKGRAEGNHGLDQDRLVKELRLAGISTIEDANRFLTGTYLPAMNEKFSRPAAESADGHVLLGTVDLKDILCFEHERTVTNDYAVRFECRLFQILKTNKSLPRPRDRAIVRIRLDRSLTILWKETPLLVEEVLLPNKGQSDTHAA